jgi:hypothetical protein
LGTDSSVAESEADDLIFKAIDEKVGIPREGVTKFRGKAKRKFNCFTGQKNNIFRGFIGGVGADAVAWLQQTLKVDNKEAVQKGQTLFMNRDVFFSVSKKHSSFHNKQDVFYKFRVTPNALPELIFFSYIIWKSTMC